MIMIRKSIFYLLLIIILNSCGYSPLYTNLEENNLSLTINNVQGNDDINKSMIKNLDKFIKNNSENNFKINISSNFNKIILSSNSAGQITNYRMELKFVFEILNIENKNKIILFEKFDIKKEDNLFDERNYEHIIKRDMIENISKKLIFQLQKIK